MLEAEEPPSRHRNDNNSWRIEKSISLPNVFMTFMQVGVLVWFMATLSAHTDDNTRRIKVQEDFQQNAIQGPNGLTERMTRMEEQEKSLQKSADRIETILANTRPQDGKRR